MVIYDNGSDDGSREYVRECGGELRDFDTGGHIDDSILTPLKNTCWKESDADYCMVVDIDELIVGPLERLERYRELGVPLVIPYGADMVSERYPTTPGQIYEEVKLGAPSKSYSKPCIVSPKWVQDLNLSPGAHNASPVMAGLPVYEYAIKLLHFKHIGRAEYIARQKEQVDRLSAYNLANGYSTVLYGEAEWQRGFDELLSRACRVI